MNVDFISLGWHNLLLGLAGRLRHPHEAVDLSTYQRSLELHYHVLGGGLGQRVTADTGGQSTRKPSTHAGKDLMAWLDTQQIHLPTALNRYVSATLNREHYFWLVAFLAMQQPLNSPAPLPVGLRHLLHGIMTSSHVCRQFPALVPRYQRLCAAELSQRETALPKFGMTRSRVHQLEAAIRYSLGSKQPPDDDWLRQAIAQAQAGELLTVPAYWRRWPTPFLPVPLWSRPAAERPGLRLRWLKRKMRRRSVGRQKSLSRPHFDAKREPNSILGQSTQGEYVYREWDYHSGTYHQNWCRVTEQTPTYNSSSKTTPYFNVNLDRLAHQVRQQFEALRQVSAWQRQLESGEDIDIDAYVDAYGDKRGFGLSNTAWYRSKRARWRDLAVAVLLDTSRSTQAWVGEHRVIEIARQSMMILAEALNIIGDDFALYGFSSDSRLRVCCDRVKGFGEAYDNSVLGRLRALTPKNYTRMGTAIRHLGKRLQQHSSHQKLLLVLTDGRPYDPTDHYTGKYALEDTRRALYELRLQGMHYFGLTIDQQGQDYLPSLFGPGQYAVYSHPQSLPKVLPWLYARITALVA